jgi:hypothetical protein
MAKLLMLKLLILDTKIYLYDTRNFILYDIKRNKYKPGGQEGGKFS